MTSVAEKRRSFDELYAEIAALPQGLTGEILVAGVLSTMGRPGRPHRRAARGSLAALRAVDQNEDGKGWWIEVEVEVRFGERLAVPDLSGWRGERVPELPDENPITITPDWCCEFLSPSTARDDKRLKLPLYAERGVGHTWLVAPDLKMVEVYKSLEGLPALCATAADSDVVVLPPFDIEIDLARWWR